MNTSKYIRILKIIDLCILFAGLSMPFIGHSFGYNPNLQVIIQEVNRIASDASYFIFVFPFIVLTAILFCVIWRKEKEISKPDFTGHVGGNILCFIPYYWLGLTGLNSLNAPQGPGIFLVPISVIFVIPVLYTIGYFGAIALLRYFEK